MKPRKLALGAPKHVSYMVRGTGDGGGGDEITTGDGGGGDEINTGDGGGKGDCGGGGGGDGDTMAGSGGGESAQPDASLHERAQFVFRMLRVFSSELRL